MDRIYKDQEMTYIETPFMNYDLTGLALLGRYQDHPFVQAGFAWRLCWVGLVQGT